MHRTLERQFKNAFGDMKPEEVSGNLANLLKLINNTYVHSDEEQVLTSRSLELSSKEFSDLNKKLDSEKKLVEQKVEERTRELKYEQEKLNIIIKNMRSGAILVNLAGTVTFVNSVACTELSITHTEDSLNILSNFFPSVHVFEFIKKALEGEPMNVPEVGNGSKIFSLSFNPLKDESQILGVLIWISDITERKLLEHDQNQFIAIASHEMRTPLAIIRGNAELMLDDEVVKDNEYLFKGVKSILSGSVRLLNIVNDFIDLQKMESGSVVLKPVSVDILQVLKETIADLMNITKEKNLHMNLVVLSDFIPSVYIDKERVRQIFINLISNAIHYTDQGDITVSVENSDGVIKILFIDTGVGMDIEEQKHLFAKFSTGKGFIKSREYGSGMGLYICKLLSTMMDCEVKLDKSNIGVGSQFSLTIPLDKKVTI
ncbi:MAG: PAS domain-containing sensor histidine kinase [bacterium]